ARSGRDDQRVVGDRAAVGQVDLALYGIEPDRLAQQHRRVAAAAEDAAQRLGDVARRDRARRDLVQQRLEDVVVAPIDEGEVDALVAAEAPGRVQAAE